MNMALLILIALITLSFISCIVITAIWIEYIKQWYEDEEENDDKLFNDDLEDKHFTLDKTKYERR